MGLPEVTYADYRDLGGTMGEEDWARALPHALAAVRAAMGPAHEPNPDWGWQVGAYKRAVCAAADVDANHGLSGGLVGGRSSFTIGSYSNGGAVGGAEQPQSAYDADMSRAVRGALAGSGLLCQVVL